MMPPRPKTRPSRRGHAPESYVSCMIRPMSLMSYPPMLLNSFWNFSDRKNVEHGPDLGPVDMLRLYDEIVAFSLHRDEVDVVDLPRDLLGAHGHIRVTAPHGAGDRQMRLVFVLVARDPASIEAEQFQVFIEQDAGTGTPLAVDDPTGNVWTVRSEARFFAHAA